MKGSSEVIQYEDTHRPCYIGAPKQFSSNSPKSSGKATETAVSDSERHPEVRSSGTLATRSAAFFVKPRNSPDLRTYIP